MAQHVRIVDSGNNSIDSNNPLSVANCSNLVPENYDEITLTYVSSGNGIGEVETVVYKKSSSTIATVTLSYNADDKLSGVVRS